MSDSTPQHTWSNCRKCLTLFKPGLVWRKAMLSKGGKACIMCILEI